MQILEDRPETQKQQEEIQKLMSTSLEQLAPPPSECYQNQSCAKTMRKTKEEANWIFENQIGIAMDRKAG